MPALVTLDANTSDELARLLNDLNLDLADIGFGEIFVAWLANGKYAFVDENGDPDYLAEETFRDLLNTLNLAAIKVKLGDALLALFDPATATAFADSLTVPQQDAIVNVFKHLNRELSHIGVAGFVDTAIQASKTPAAATTPGTGGTTTPGGGTTNPPVTVTITPKATLPVLKVGGPALSASDIFDISPANTVVELNTDATTYAAVSGNPEKVVASAPGDVLIVCSVGNPQVAGAIKAEVTITVQPADPVKTVTKRADVTGKTVGETVATTDLFTLGGGANEADLTITPTPAASVTVAPDKKTITVIAPGTITIKAKIGTGAEVSATITAAAAPATPKTLKLADGTATIAAKAVALTAADGVKTILVTDSADAKVPGLAADLETAGDSTKLAVTLDADGKTVKLTPVAGQTGDVNITLTATGYTTETVVVKIN